MVDPAARQRVHERLGHVLLTDHLGEGGRTVFPVERESHGATLALRYDKKTSRIRPPGCQADQVAANAAALSALGALLAIVTLVGGFASIRLHGAYRDALRGLGESERRLDTGEVGHVDGRLDPELRWLAEVRDAARDSGWQESAILVSLLCVAEGVLGIWALSEGVRTLDAVAVVTLVAAAVLVTILLVVDGLWIRAALAATVQRSPLRGLLRLENLLIDSYVATARMQNAHRSWLRTLVAGYPFAGLVGRWRLRAYLRAVRRRDAAAGRLERWGAPDEALEGLAGAGVRPPAGYVEGLRGLVPLVIRPSSAAGSALPLDDDADWDAALDNLNRAVDLDRPRRLRWLSALAACAELRDDPVARESAARWTLEMAALRQAGTLGSKRRGPLGIAADRFDPLRDATLVEPRRPATWEAALRRGRETDVHPRLLASVIVHWAYALVLDRPAVPDVPAATSPAISTAVEIMRALPEREVDPYLRVVRAGLSDLGASGAQMGRLVPPRPRAPAPEPAPPAPAGTAPAASAPPVAPTAPRPRSPE
jgi:hypothetical protein